MSNIFLLEDNDSLGKSLDERLGQEGYSVSWCTNLADARGKIATGSFDLAIVDVMLPDGSGIDFARTVVRPLRIPVVFLSAFSTAEYRMEAFDAGALDYIPKPFHLRELLLRIKRVIETKRAESVVRIGSTTINLSSMAVTTEQGTISYLAPRDFELFQALFKSSPKALSREELIQLVWGGDTAGNARTVDNAIVRLRQALGDEASICLRSVRGVGYQWVQER